MSTVTRPTVGSVEDRVATEAPAPAIDGRRLHGVIPYSVQSRDLGGFTEVIEPGALAGADLSQLVCTREHNLAALLGRHPTTLTTEDRSDGFSWSCELPRSPVGEDVRVAVERGDLRSTSFRFVVAPGGERWDGDVRHVTAISELRDVTVTASPAYGDHAPAEYRSTPEPDPAAPSQDEPIEENTVQTETAPPVTEAPAGGLAVEDRSAAPPSVEERIADGLRGVNKGESRALTTAASVSPGELSVVLFDRLRASSVVLATGIKTLTTTADSVTYPTLVSDVLPAWTAEAATIAPGDPTFATLTATPRKLGHLVQFSNEVLDDSDPSIATVLNQHLLTVLALKLDAGLLEGTGVSPEIRGLKNIAGIQTVAAGANGATATLDMIADAIALLEAVNVPRERMRIVLHPRNVATLRKLKASTGGTYLWSADPATSSPSGIFGVPVYSSPQLGTIETQGTSGAVANSAYVYDVDSLVYVQRTPIEVELDRSRLFNSDQSEMRAKLRGDLISPTPTGIVRVTGLLA